MENLMKKEKQQKNTVKVRLLVFATLALLLIVLSFFSDKLCPMDPYLGSFKCQGCTILGTSLGNRSLWTGYAVTCDRRK